MKTGFTALAVLAFLPSAAVAYPSMIRHGYTECASCHADPSGGTLLTEYGRAQSELLLSSSYGKGAEAEAGKASKFLFGAFEVPSALLLGGWIRNGYIWNTVDSKLVDNRYLQMRADLAAELRLGPVRAAAELGYATGDSASQTELAQVTRNPGGNLVSREHWIGLAFGEESGLIRAGRFNVPFGLRNIEHTSFVRTATQTDINQDQQGGVAFALTQESWRTEVMAILGNYSLHPDAYRERGFAGYVETALSRTVAVGVSALATRADAARDTRLPTLRQAYGVTARVAPWTPLVLSAELDGLITSALGRRNAQTGYAGWLQADLEVLRGVHLLPAVEQMSPPNAGPSTFGLWGGVAWFVFPHFDVRGDVIRRSTANAPATNTFLLQVNGYL